MSKINAVRLINLNYNNNAIRISDETFHMNGKSTLLSLRNGGGKSVLVQMMMAPFVHKRYRDAKERPFESYFTTNRPTFILVEWALDQGAGYVMTGMMVRRRQEISAETSDNLEILSFISEYRSACAQDIHHLPVVEKRKKEMVLKSFSACRQLFESYKKDASAAFFCYDMNNSAQSRQYFDKLMEYQIHYKEWETIMKKVNLKESGLSDLFADCRDEKGLVEKWLLDAVESRLNKDKDRMKEFQSILEKYVIQYKDNQSKIQRRDIIRQFSAQAEGVMEAALNYQAAEDEMCRQKQRIGVFLWQLETAKAGSGERRVKLEADCGQITADIAHLRYQQISKAVYEAVEAEKYCRAEREMIQLERDAKEQETAQAQYLLYLMDCARQQLEMDEQHAQCLQYEQQLELLNQEEKDFARERGRLGGMLRMYYEAESRRGQEQILKDEEALKKLDEMSAAEEEKAAALRAQALEHSISIGSMRAKIQEYDQKEETYNARYAPGFIRNILGEYEPAALEIGRSELEKELDGLKKAYLQMLRSAEEGSWKQKENERDLEDARQKKMRSEAQLAQAQQLCRTYEDQLQERRKIMRYFGLEETSLYDMEKILHAAQRTLSEIELAKRRLEKEEDQLQKEYRRLTQGRVLELPKEFEKLLEDMGISYVYGMEWLKKNEYPKAENEKLVRAHPFLPYALLLSRRDMHRLKQLNTDDPKKSMPYVSFPVPLLAREQLESVQDAGEQAVRDFSEVSFYMLFNRHLLNEEKLRQMAADFEQQIQEKKEKIQLRREEYESFFEKKERLRSQTATKELVTQAEKKREQLEEEGKELADEIVKRKEEAEQFSLQLRKLQQQIQDTVKQLGVSERRIEDLKELERSYEAYIGHKERLGRLQRELAQMKEKESLSLNTAEKLRERAKKQELALEHLKKETEKLEEKAAYYKQYEKPAKRKLPTGSGQEAAGSAPQPAPEDIAAAENRYQAITSRLSLRQQEIERLLKSAQERLLKITRELARRQKKYRLKDGEWKQTVYDARAEEYQEKLLDEKRKQYELKQAQWNEADKNAALASQKLEQQKSLLLEKCGQSEPLARDLIQPADFEAEIEKCEYQRRELEKVQQHEQKRSGWYEENLTALAEYTEFMPKDEAQLWEFLENDMKADTPKGQESPAVSQSGAARQEDAAVSQSGLARQLEDAAQRRHALEVIAAQQSAMENLNGEELRRRKGMLVRDHNHCQQSRQKQKERLNGLLNEMVRREIFAEDFYRKPIEAMLTLADDAGRVIRQLRTTLQSYENLMEKIQVDISVVEEEKLRISELLCEYIHEVHQNLGRIDHNSTISIRGKSIRMLKIILPDWEENLELYQIRIRDFMDETTKHGIELLEQNENAQEYLGVRMTTKNLYDVTAGIENVQIRLYKIEEQREVPITWSQVARNSGGEGFLSAFIILSSLLFYMRHDDSDLFAQRNEGKVLVMDNPFAQTNASHLLKPLMDMAKKTNTQLICLSGLGGESIYNRFDNIYVLNLTAAGLRSGLQYLKAEHMRGNEEETMVVSQIEVLGQQELIF